MAGIITEVNANFVIDGQLGGSGATLYLGIMATSPADDGSGGTEVAGGSYARVAFTDDATTWPAAATRQKKNGIDFTFPAPTADWGTDMWGLGIWNAAVAGTPAQFFKAGSPFTILNGDPAFVVPANAMTIREVNIP